MIKDYLQPEDFLMDDTFKKYCEGSDERSIRFWEKWITDNPSKSHLTEKARYMYQILSANISPLNVQTDKLNAALQPQPQLKKRYILWYAAAACFLAVLMAGLFYYIDRPDQPILYSKSFETGFGSKKKIVLPDGTLVYLNSGSEVKMEEGFNRKTRMVHLIGEAYFEVAHNKEKPFKVLTDNFNVTVLGTVFNLKAYPTEGISEASLIEGSIKVQSKEGDQENTVTLSPGQKIVFYRNEKTPTVGEKVLPQQRKVEMGQLTKLDTTIVETAWVDNNMVFNALTWKEIEPIMERWYGVDIELGDDTVAGYQYTATFSKENIFEVLKSLQEVKPFKYKMKGGQITITK